MAPRSQNKNPETLRKELIVLFENFESSLKSGTLRQKVLALIPAFRSLRNLGCSLIPANIANSARERIIHYFQQYPNIVIKGDELLVVSGIQEYARRIRELRVQYGWKIYSGVTIKELIELNNSISKEAKELTLALKGNSKIQGNWGEMILESILEKSGLEKGREFSIQESTYNDEGKRLIADVVINYPDGRKIVIDSKVSLNAYTDLLNCEDQNLQEVYKKKPNQLSGGQMQRKNISHLFAIILTSLKTKIIKTILAIKKLNL